MTDGPSTGEKVRLSTRRHPLGHIAHDVPVQARGGMIRFVSIGTDVFWTTASVLQRLSSWPVKDNHSFGFRDSVRGEITTFLCPTP